MKIDISEKNAYQAVIDKVLELANNDYDDFVVHLKTSVLGKSNELLLSNDFGSGASYTFLNDWYEGGDVELLGFSTISALNIPDLKEA